LLDTNGIRRRLDFPAIISIATLVFVRHVHWQFGTQVTEALGTYMNLNLST
jgi:hypothetical protein